MTYAKNGRVAKSVRLGMIRRQHLRRARYVDIVVGKSNKIDSALLDDEYDDTAVDVPEVES